MADDRTEYLNLLDRISQTAGSVYALGRQLWALSMQRAGQQGDGERIYYPSWLLWGALTDWEENKPKEHDLADAAMKEAAADFLQIVGDPSAERAYFDRWIYDRMGCERPKSSG